MIALAAPTCPVMGRRTRPLPALTTSLRNYRRQPATAIVLPPTPVLLTATTAVSAFIYLTTRPLLAFLASAYLGTKLSISGLSIAPLRRRVSLRGLRLRDPRGRPLVAVPEISVALKGPPPVASDPPSSKPTSAQPSPRQPRRVLDVRIDNPSVVAIFDSYDFSASNWTLFTQNFLSRRQPAKEPPQPPKPVSAPAPPKQPGVPPASTDVHVAIDGGVHLSLRSSLLDDARLINDVTLSAVELSATELRRPDALTRFVESLAARAVSSARWRSFPREFRTGARRYARRVLADGVASSVRVTRDRVKQVRQQVDLFDEFVLRDLPDTGRAGEAVKGFRNVLSGLESFLGANEEGEEREESAPTGPPQASQGQEESSEPDVEEQQPARDTQQPTEFRELDEDYTPRSPRQGAARGQD